MRTIRNVLSGRANIESCKKLRLSIYRVTGKQIALPQLSKGPYSNSPIVRGLAAFCSYRRGVSLKFTKIVSESVSESFISGVRGDYDSSVDVDISSSQYEQVL